jgi:hypothetical protein
MSRIITDILSYREEIFGSLLTLFPFDTEEVVRLANDTSLRLASYFFTKDVDRAWRLLEGLELGMIGMNLGVLIRPCCILVVRLTVLPRQLVLCGVSLWRNKRVWMWQASRKGCCH